MDRRKMHKANGQRTNKNRQISSRTRTNNRAANQDAARDLEPEIEVQVVKPSRAQLLQKWRKERDEKKKAEELLKRKPFVSVVKRGVFLDKTNYTELNKQRRKNHSIKKVPAVQNLREPQNATSMAAEAASNNISTRRTTTRAVTPVDNQDHNDTGTVAMLEHTRTPNGAESLAVPDNASVLNSTFEMDNSESQSSRTPNGAELLAVPDTVLNSTFEMETSVENSRAPDVTNDMLAVEGTSSDLNTTFERANPVEADTQPTNFTPKSSLNSSLNYVSPFVTIARGKGSASKEVKVRESFYKLELSQPQLDSPKIRQNREAAEYFRFQMNQEKESLLKMVDTWAKYKDENEHVDSVYLDQIDVANGQTQLLIRKKFKQFHDLCDECEKGVSQPPVLPKDLEGFWSMVFMQVENCSERFRKLATLKENDWIEVDLLPVKVERKTKRKAAKKGTASSGIQKMIEEARLKMKESRITAPVTSNDNGGPSFSMTLRQTPARRSFSVAQTPKSIIKAKTPGGQRNAKSVAFSFVESPSTSESSNKATATPKPRVIKRRASTSGIEKSNSSIMEGKSTFLTPNNRKVSNDHALSSSVRRRSNRRLFSVAEK